LALPALAEPPVLLPATAFPEPPAFPLPDAVVPVPAVAVLEPATELPAPLDAEDDPAVFAAPPVAVSLLLSQAELKATAANAMVDNAAVSRTWVR
jgi:hypothetical protein